MGARDAAVEHALARIGAAFRLSRLYPSTHPALAEAHAQVRMALTAVTAALPIELRLLPHGAQWTGGPGAPAQGGPLADLATLLFAHGVRMLTFGSGTTLEHVLVLFGAATGKAAVDDPGLGPIALSRAARRSTQRVAVEPEADAPPPGTPELRQRYTAGMVFRPDALPPDIMARRGIQSMRAARDATGRESAAAMLAPVAAELAARRHAGLSADAILALDAARQAEEGHVGPALARAVAAFADGEMALLLLERLADPGTPPGERDLVARAVGVLTDEAAGLVIDAYLAAPAEGREPFRDAIRSVGTRAVAPLEPYLNHERPDVAAVAIEFVGLVGGARIPDLLTPRARHADPRVRESALLGLAHAGGRALVRTAVPALRDASAAVRGAAARALGAAGDASAVDVLVRRTEEEEDEGALAEVLRAIGRLGGPAALPALARFAQPGTLLHRRSAFLRSAAVGALGLIPGPEARALLEHYTQDREAAVRLAAQAAMTT
jgi:hypothetical protein